MGSISCGFLNYISWAGLHFVDFSMKMNSICLFFNSDQFSTFLEIMTRVLLPKGTLVNGSSIESSTDT